MRESIGGTSLFIMVITFVILFTGFMCLTINHTKAFKTKDEIIQIISQNGGFGTELNKVDRNNPVMQKIVESIQEKAYRTEIQRCPDGYTGFDRNGNKGGSKSSFCIREVDSRDSKSSNSNLQIKYYEVILYYRLELPILDGIGSGLFDLKVKGNTKLIYENGQELNRKVVK